MADQEQPYSRRLPALQGLSSPSTHLRLRAARDLASSARAEDRPALIRALRSEKDPWVQQAIDAAISHAGEPSGRTPEGENSPVEAPVAFGRDTLARFVIHELEPILGKIRHYAAQEIAVYESSRTRRELENLELVLDSVTSLSKAGAIGTPSEFDLAKLIGDIRSGVVSADSEVVVELAGSSSLAVVGDPGQLRLAISNGLRNAVESVEQSSDPARRRVLITWGETDKEVWITILDRGDGLRSPGRPLDRVSSTKPGHQGVGLQIARRAASALGGELELADRPSGGVRFEIRWPGIARLVE